MRALFIAAALAFGAALAGCETMSAEECAAADWGHLGFTDASTNGADRFGARAESCGRQGLPADGGAYAAGFADGMRQFCQPPQAFQYALRGGEFAGSCPIELQRDFYAAYGDGRRVYQARYELDQARDRLGVIPSRIDEIDDDIRDRLEAQRGQQASDEEAERRRREIEDLRKERRDLVDERRDLEPRIVYLQRRVDDLHYEIGNRWAPW